MYSVKDIPPRRFVMADRRRNKALMKIGQSSYGIFRAHSLDSRRHWGKFCKTTSVHGMKYLAEPSRSWLERFWWIAVVFFGFLSASYYVSRQFVKWSQTAIEADNYDLQEDMMKIPFPAFTVCDNRKIYLQDNYTVEGKHLNLLYMLCGDDRLTNCNYTVEDFIKWSPPLISECELQLDDKEVEYSIVSDCERMVVRTLTDQGICYTFNMLDPIEIFKENVLTGHGHHGRRSDWKLEKGYLPTAALRDSNGSNSLESGPFPKRAKHGVVLSIFHENQTTPGYCAGKSDGFKIILHSPHEMPMVGFRESPWTVLQDDAGTGDKYVDIPAHGKILVDVRARMIVANEDLKIYSPNQRRCFFPGERELSYFKEYTFNNCHLECLTNYTLDICGCKDFYMPFPSKQCKCVQCEMVWPQLPGSGKCLAGTWNWNDTKVCTGGHAMRCIHHAFDLWDKHRKDCTCLPTCTTLEYETKTWYNNRPIINEREEEGLKKTLIVVYSTDPKYVKSERRAVYSLVDFIADCGGVFGLFCGMSIISIVEFIYFSILWLINRRAFYNP